MTPMMASVLLSTPPEAAYVTYLCISLFCNSFRLIDAAGANVIFKEPDRLIRKARARKDIKNVVQVVATSVF